MLFYNMKHYYLYQRLKEAEHLEEGETLRRGEVVEHGVEA